MGSSIDDVFLFELARISLSAVLVQTKALGFAFHALTQARMSASSGCTQVASRLQRLAARP